MSITRLPCRRALLVSLISVVMLIGFIPAVHAAGEDPAAAKGDGTTLLEDPVTAIKQLFGL
jgi:hypothetical protein